MNAHLWIDGDWRLTELTRELLEAFDIRIAPGVEIGEACHLTSGTFTGGYFHGGYFHGGYFHGGIFEDGMFYGGTFNGGLYSGPGMFYGGEFNGGTYQEGIFRGGEFNDGKFKGGTFHGGTFNGGYYSGPGMFYGGEFNDGDFFGGIFTGGIFTGGTFQSGEFAGGTFYGGRFRNVWIGDGTFWRGDYCGGMFHSTPPQILLNNGFEINIARPGYVKIERATMHIKKWLKDYKAVVAEWKQFGLVSDEEVHALEETLEYCLPMLQNWMEQNSFMTPVKKEEMDKEVVLYDDDNDDAYYGPY